MTRATHEIAWLLVSLLAVATVANASQPLHVPTDEPVYSVPMATIDGRGAVRFHIALGMLVTKDGAPAGLYRSYPSKSAVPLIEQYGLGMLGTRDGVILASYDGIPLLVLHGHIDGHVGHYALSVAYLTSVVPRRYAHCILRIAHTPQGQWETVNRAGHRITTFTVVSRNTGIRSISPCD